LFGRFSRNHLRSRLRRANGSAGKYRYTCLGRRNLSGLRLGVPAEIRRATRGGPSRVPKRPVRGLKKGPRSRLSKNAQMQGARRPEERDVHGRYAAVTMDECNAADGRFSSACQGAGHGRSRPAAGHRSPMRPARDEKAGTFGARANRRRNTHGAERSAPSIAMLLNHGTGRAHSATGGTAGWVRLPRRNLVRQLFARPPE
jgi:hypothetical protein